MDELIVMTWVEMPTLTSSASLSTVDPKVMSLIVVGADGLPPREREHLRTRTWSTPVIAIGRETEDLRCEHVLPARLTSRELKRALRSTLFEAPASARTASAVG